jgi:hypothetical protein
LSIRTKAFFCQIREVDGVPRNCEVAAMSVAVEIREAILPAGVNFGAARLTSQSVCERGPEDEANAQHQKCKEQAPADDRWQCVAQELGRSLLTASSLISFASGGWIGLRLPGHFLR